jgi:putative spermidine/putrescine transport system substrate-binding protein
LYDTEAGLEGLKRLVDLRPVWSANDFNPMYETGEANVGLMYKNQAYTLLDKGVPVKWVYPKKGAFSLSWGWSIAKNTKNLPWAKHYLNLPLDPQGQTHFTDYNNYAGSNRKMSDHLSPEKRERVTFSEAELASLIEPDHDFLDERRDEWTKRWNVIVAGS